MAEQQVNIIIRIMQEGADNAKKAKDSLTDLNKETDKAAQSETKQNTAVALLNTNLGKEIPELKALSPLMSAMGLSSLMTGTAVAGMGVALVEASQSFQGLMGDVATFGVTANNVTSGPMMDWSTSMGETQKLSNTFGLSIEDTTKAMAIFMGTTHDTARSETLLRDAYKDATATGRPFMDVVKELNGVVDGSVKVYDKSTGALLAGNDAVVQFNKNSEAMRTGVGTMQSDLDMLADKGLERLKIGFGFLGTVLKDVFVTAPLAAFGSALTEIDNLLNNIGQFDWKKLLGPLAGAGIGAGVGLATFGPLGALVGGILGLGVGGLVSNHLAAGGIVTRPTVALIGESGPEAVTPLNGANAGPQEINLYLSDGTMLARWVMGEIDTNMRLRNSF